MSIQLMSIQRLRLLWNRYSTLSLSLYMGSGMTVYTGLYIRDFDLDNDKREVVKNMFLKANLDIDENPILYRLGKVYILAYLFEAPRIIFTLGIVFLYSRFRSKHLLSFLKK